MNKDDFEGSNVVKDCDGNSQKEKKKEKKTLKNSPEMSGKTTLVRGPSLELIGPQRVIRCLSSWEFFFSSAKTTSDS